MAGIDWAMRKAATPARTTRMRTPAPVALPANRRSPLRRTCRGAGACEVVVTPAPRTRVCSWVVMADPARGVGDAPGRRISRAGSLRRDRVDRPLALLAGVIGDRRGAG